MLRPDSEAVLRYRSGDFEIVIPGTYVCCVVTGERIPLKELRYWSFERQEAYLDARAATRRAAEAGGRDPSTSGAASDGEAGP